MSHDRNVGKGRFSAVAGRRGRETGVMAAGMVLALAAEADAQAAVVPTVSNAGVTAARLVADGALEVTLADGQTLLLAADQFTLAADGTVVLADAALEQIAAMLGIEATNLGVALAPLAGAGGVGLAIVGGGGNESAPIANTAVGIQASSTKLRRPLLYHHRLRHPLYHLGYIPVIPVQHRARHTDILRILRRRAVLTPRILFRPFIYKDNILMLHHPHRICPHLARPRLPARADPRHPLDRPGRGAPPRNRL